ncbi:MAG: thioredoxin family protein [Phycisphaerae bacterium]
MRPNAFMSPSARATQATRASRANRIVGRIGAALAVICIAGLAAGCKPAAAGDDPQLIMIPADWESFDRQVLKSPVPIVIEFSKDPCPPCVEQTAELEELMNEFRGRATFAAMTLVRGEFEVTCPEIQDRYNILWMPTTILFVDGKERKRWRNLQKSAGIREELKQALLEKSAKP